MRNRIPLPTSRAARFRLSLVDALCAAAAPVLALLIRDAELLDHGVEAGLYCALSFGIALAAFASLRVNDPLPEHFSAMDAMLVVKAAFSAQVLTLGALFLITRLDGVPRSTFVIQAFLLSGGMLGARLTQKHRKLGETHADRPNCHEHVLLVGANALSSMYLHLIDGNCPGMRAVAVLDDRRELWGRSIVGVPITGPIEDLDTIIREFRIHGISIDSVKIPEVGRLALSGSDCLRAKCDAEGVRADFLPSPLALQADPDQPPPTEPDLQWPSAARYLRRKRQLDVAASVGLMVLLAPLFVVIGLLVLCNLGRPVLFWQHRIGYMGKKFSLLKFRTYSAPYDRAGKAVEGATRLGRLGAFLRKSRLDEMPQLYNVLTGDMSLVGPRPLLSCDQPPDPRQRLMVRPGITGWAQIHGGTRLSPAEKSALDAWYIRNASFALDSRILWKSLGVVLRGDTPSNGDDLEPSLACDGMALREGSTKLRPVRMREDA